MDTVARLDTAEASLGVGIRPAAGAVWDFLGPRIGATARSLKMPAARATFALEAPTEVTLMPVPGDGWFGPPAIDLGTSTGHRADIRFSETEAHADEGLVQVEMRDPDLGVVCVVRIEACEGGAIRIETTLENTGSASFTVERLASAVLPLPPAGSEIVSWRGIHAGEFAECREPLPAHGWYREMRAGITGHGGPPGIYLLAEEATFDAGWVLAMQLAWSGDSRLAIERLDDGQFVLTAEALLQPGELSLEPGMRHVAPPVYLALSQRGRNGAMEQQHAAVREMVGWPEGAMPPRPVHLNSWEACYFAHDESRIVALARVAAALGAERFVLDDGWFRGRSDDRRALGDWTPDETKYPAGLTPLARKVAALGMEFGLWVEPEMVSPDSDLYRNHPEWALATPGRTGPLGRSQLVLDMRRADVRDYLFDALSSLLEDGLIRYLKWDHNRALAPPGGAAQVAGTYQLLNRLRSAHPEVEIESCAAGGGRCDAGVARYVQRFWTSDNLDAVSRVSIQRGFVAFLPPEMMGAHVGASPAHATGRRQSLAFRAAVACMGHLGVELDPARLTEHERTELAGWIEFYKRLRHVIHGGRLRLGRGQDGLVWQAHGDGKRWILFASRVSPSRDKRPRPLPLPFAGGQDWKVQCLRLAGANRWLGTDPWTVGDDAEAVEIAGDWLATNGIPLPPMAGEAVAIFDLEPVS